MAYVLADNIISPLGTTSEENYQQVKAGKSGIRTFEPGSHGIPEGFTASLLSDEEQSIMVGDEKLTFKHSDFEHLAIASVKQALAQASVSSVSSVPKIPISSDRVVFILSSTKGNIEALGEENQESRAEKAKKIRADKANLSSSAQRIANALGITTPPIVVCNACISGLSALILGSRLIEMGRYDYAVVCGIDCPDRFIISGFQSLKALSTIPCRPFDIERFGLNLGEAAATIILGKEPARSKDVTGRAGFQYLPSSKIAQTSPSPKNTWQIGAGFIKNDAFHISAPSKTAEGLYAALEETLEQVYKNDNTLEDNTLPTVPLQEDLAFINAHGTATLFNDQMESIAIERAGLSDCPTNALKGYFGHTLGAAGILETIISMKAIDDHTILGTRGFEELGVSGKVNISAENQPTDKHAFIKMLSGFGGCNATLWVGNTASLPATASLPMQSQSNRAGRETFHFLKENVKGIERKHSIRITPDEIVVDGELWGKNPSLTALYKQHISDYPKFYKMDGLSRLGFVASEILLQQEESEVGKINNLLGKSESEVGKSENEVEKMKSEVGKINNLLGKSESGVGKMKSLADHSFDRAIILFNHSSSIASDRKYLASIANPAEYFPSPSVFVYTLPNIVTGEIAMRNGYHGETSFYILPHKDEGVMSDILYSTLLDPAIQSVMSGWLDYEDEKHFEADISIYENMFKLYG